MSENHNDETTDSSPRSEDVRMVERDRRHQEVHDHRLACWHLFTAGATEEEVDDILTDRHVPIDPDEEWAYAELTRYRKARREDW